MAIKNNAERTRERQEAQQKKLLALWARGKASREQIERCMDLDRLLNAKVEEAPKKLGRGDRETPFVKGPWRIDAAAFGLDLADHTPISSPEHMAFAQVVTLMDGGTVQDTKRCKANATLIAAAPDLYAALTMLVKMVGKTPMRLDMTEARLALAKAVPDGN